MFSFVANSRCFRATAILMAAVTAYVPSALGVNAVFGSIGDAIRQYARLPHGPYTTVPGTPFLGKHPGRDPKGRGGIWKNIPDDKFAMTGGHRKVVTAFNCLSHVTAVSPTPGNSYPWEGSAATPGGAINTGNGNVLTTLPLVSWKSRGFNMDFTLYHNSESNYDGELGEYWTWTYDIYINVASGNPTVHWGNGLCIPYTASGSTYTPPAGTYDKLVQNTGGTWTLTKKNGTQYLFNASGFCTSIVDLHGNTITLTLNSGNYCTKVTDPTGKSLTINLNGSDQFTSIVDPLGRTWTFTISGNELTNVEWPALNGDNYSDQYTYTSLNDIATHTDKRGNVWTKTYNSDGSIATATDPLSHETVYGYSSTATTVTDPLSHVRTDNYSSGLLASSEDESGFSTSYTSYDANNNPLTVVDENSQTRTYTYDSLGNTLTKTDPLSHEWVWTYNSLSEPLTSTDPLSNETQYSYDSYGDLLTEIDPLSHTVQTNTWDSYGDKLTSKDALSNTTTFGYDSNGNCTSIEDPLLNTTSIGVDSLNRTVSVTDPLTHEEQIAYDEWGRVVTETHPDSTVVSKGWDTENDQISLTDENTHTTNYSFDAAKRLVSTTNADSNVESYGYDNANRRTSVTDGNGHVRNYTFTNRGEVATLTLADGSEEQWAYDGNGNTTAYVNGLSQTVDYVFDAANRETAVDYPSGTDTSFSFDNSNRQTGMTDATGTTTWGYDASSRQTSLSTPQGNMTYTFDNAGRRLTMVEAVGTTSYAYDADSRLTSLENPYSETTSLTYDNASRLTKKTFASGAYDSFGFDTRNRTTSVTHYNSSGAVLSAESYTLDAASNLTAKTVDSLTTSYTFDSANQILTESNTGYSSTYTYDANGNRLSQDLNGTTYSYTYDSGDKLDTVKNGSTTVKSYSYDAAGRTTAVATSAGTTSLSYDYENRVTGITYPSLATNSFTYNGLDTRVGKVDSTGTYTFKRDGAGVTDPVLSDGTIAYTPGTSERKSSTTTFDHANYLGTFTRQTNSSQTTTATRVYDAFGNLESTTGTPQSPFGFVGQEGYQEDSDSGLKLLGHRYYDPSTGRFLTRDPVKDGRNWYCYCSNNSLRFIDPTGFGPVQDFFEAIFLAYDNFSGTDGVDGNGNPIRVGGWTNRLNPPGNGETFNGTVHLPDVPTAAKYNHTKHWRNHEEGHIQQWRKVGGIMFAVAYVAGAVMGGIETGGKSDPGGPLGHDHNPVEELAELYAYAKDKGH